MRIPPLPSLLALLPVLGAPACAPGTSGGMIPRRTAVTLVDDAREGAFDTWQVFAAEPVDGSVLILGTGAEGALAEIRFVPAADGSAVVLAQTAGRSAELDLAPDGRVTGEAHTPEADAMLAEMARDVGDRADEVAAAVAADGAASMPGGARAELRPGLDFGCALQIYLAWIVGHVADVCDVVVRPGRLVLRVAADEPAGWAAWKTAELDPTYGRMEIAPTDTPSVQAISALIPGSALDLGVYAIVQRPEAGSIRYVELYTRGAWRGERTVEVDLRAGADCGGRTCDVCLRHVEPPVCGRSF